MEPLSRRVPEFRHFFGAPGPSDRPSGYSIRCSQRIRLARRINQAPILPPNAAAARIVAARFAGGRSIAAIRRAMANLDDQTSVSGRCVPNWPKAFADSAALFFAPALPVRRPDRMEHRLRIQWLRQGLGDSVAVVALVRIVEAERFEQRDDLRRLPLGQDRELEGQLVAPGRDPTPWRSPCRTERPFGDLVPAGGASGMLSDGSAACRARTMLEVKARQTCSFVHRLTPSSSWTQALPDPDHRCQGDSARWNRSVIRSVTYVTALSWEVAHAFRAGAERRRAVLRRCAISKGKPMDLASTAQETLSCADGYHGDSQFNSSLASPEEGCQLVRAFLRVQRGDIREQVINLVEEILRRQGVN
jgi:hypothetical protein